MRLAKTRHSTIRVIREIRVLPKNHPAWIRVIRMRLAKTRHTKIREIREIRVL